MVMEEALTILIPVYNEEECIPSLILALNQFLKRVRIPTHICFINDGSTDGSAELIERICEHDQRYSFISLEKNGGLSTALKAGIDLCQTKFVGYMDADLQTHPIDFLKLIEFKDDYDLVTGYRLKRKDTRTKKITSWLANSFKRWLLKDNIIDTGCPLKIMRTDVARRIPFFNGMHRYLPTMVLFLGGTVKQVPIPHYPRHAGKAKYNFLNRFPGPIIDALMFRWMRQNIIRYKIKKVSQEKPKHEVVMR